MRKRKKKILNFLIWKYARDGLKVLLTTTTQNISVRLYDRYLYAIKEQIQKIVYM